MWFLIAYTAPGDTLVQSSNLNTINERVADGKAATICDSFSAHFRHRNSDLLLLRVKDAPAQQVGFIYAADRVDHEHKLYIEQFKDWLTSTYGSNI
jgi:hypothetical protein